MGRRAPRGRLNSGIWKKGPAVLDFMERLGPRRARGASHICYGYRVGSLKDLWPSTAYSAHWAQGMAFDALGRIRMIYRRGEDKTGGGSVWREMMIRMLTQKEVRRQRGPCAPMGGDSATPQVCWPNRLTHKQRGMERGSAEGRWTLLKNRERQVPSSRYPMFKAQARSPTTPISCGRFAMLPLTRSGRCQPPRDNGTPRKDPCSRRPSLWDINCQVRPGRRAARPSVQVSLWPSSFGRLQAILSHSLTRGRRSLITAPQQGVPHARYQCCAIPASSH